MTSTFPLASPDAQLEAHRQQFSALANKAYFNYGGQGPMPTRSLAAIQQAHTYIQQAGPFSGEVNQWVVRVGQNLRRVIAAELGVSINTITLTEDVSVGCNIALWGIDWQAGDHLLLSDCEHPGIVAAAGEIGRRFGVEVTTCGLMATLNHGDPVTVIADHLRPTTRLVVVSHLLWNTGQVLPLKEIMQTCHHYPAERATVRVLVDAAQSVGMMPLDLDAMDVDFYAFTGHKWLCGPAGVGGLYVSVAAREDLNPTFVGWRSITKNAAGFPTGWQPDGTRYEVATSDYALYDGLAAAIATHQQWGTAEARYQRILALSRLLWQQLSDLPHIACLRTAPPESGLVSFRLTDSAQTPHHQFVHFLEQQGLFIRTILDPDCVRACVHYFTSEAEVARLTQTIQQFTANL